MKRYYPFRVYKGRREVFISLSYLVPKNTKYECSRGMMYSGLVFSLGDTFIPYRFKSIEEVIHYEKSDSHLIKKKTDYNYYFKNRRRKGLQPYQYYFLNFTSFNDTVELKNTSTELKKLKVSLDIKEDYLKKGKMPLVVTDNRETASFVFGIGIIDFFKRRIELITLDNYPIKIGGFL